ncbi:MAG TPA: MOSC N-terminal beta barrel domain-containing protein [Opitutaceae bacterium]|nr:MOSC N-terminal beta barrel domain-containing protein [Opitutaceae bacterium]
MHVTALHVYPVKSLRGFAVPAAEVDAFGFAGDRNFLVVDPAGKFLTQRALPRMALVATALSADALTLSAAGFGSVSVRRAPDPAAPVRPVTVWKAEGLLAEDCGDEAAAFLSRFLEAPLRLVRIGPQYHRPVGDRDDVVSFADGYPFLLLSEASLADLNDRLAAQDEDRLGMDRFRPNIVVNSCAAFAEDGWSRLRIGPVAFRNAGPCARCIMTTTDQLTAVRGKEPLYTLATYRRDRDKPANVNFGINLIHETKRGTIRVGDPVSL